MAKGDNYQFRILICTLLTMYCTVVSEGRSVISALILKLIYYRLAKNEECYDMH